MNSFSNSEKSFNKQLAVTYIVFMMAGSYFYKCNHPSQFKRMYLHYAEMPQQKQYMAEEQVISVIEKFDDAILNRMSELCCEVRCWQEDEKYMVEFDTCGFGRLEAEILQNGKVNIMPQLFAA